MVRLRTKTLAGGLATAFVAAFVLFVSLPSPASAGVGSLVSVEPRVEIGRAGDWSDAAVGSVLEEGDQLRTDASGRLRAVFQDDSVVSLGEDSLLTVDASVFAPDQGKVASAMSLFGGKVRTIVSDYYTDPNADFTVKTPTAVSGVRGTDFTVIYDAERKVTDVVCLTGRVAVFSTADTTRSRGVIVSAGQSTTVAEGQDPTEPTAIGDEFFRTYLPRLEFVGSGAAESFAVRDPLVRAGEVGDPFDAGDGNLGGPDGRDPSSPGDQAQPDGGQGDQGQRQPDQQDPSGDPATGGQATRDPVTGEPITGEPITGDPATGDPATGVPSTRVPGTGVPGTGDGTPPGADARLPGSGPAAVGTGVPGGPSGGGVPTLPPGVDGGIAADLLLPGGPGPGERQPVAPGDPEPGSEATIPGVLDPPPASIPGDRRDTLSDVLRQPPGAAIGEGTVGIPF